MKQWSAGKLILSGPSPKVSTWNSNWPTATTHSKGIFIHKVLNNSPDHLTMAQRFISHQSHYTISENNLYMPRPKLDLFKTSILCWSIPGLELLASKYEIMHFSSLLQIYMIIYAHTHIYIHFCPKWVLYYTVHVKYTCMSMN